MSSATELPVTGFPMMIIGAIAAGLLGFGALLVAAARFGTRLRRGRTA